MAFLVIKLASSYVNFLNFLLFDVLLISLIFFFTADICGRLNFLSLLDGSTKPLVAVSPPLFGGGLCSTGKCRAHIMLAVRITAVMLVFATAFAIDGATEVQKRNRMEKVRVPGPFPKNGNISQFMEAVNLQKTCQISSQGLIYFGKLYENGDCEIDTSLLQDQIRFKTLPEWINVTLTCERTRIDNKHGRALYEHNCSQQSSLIHCFQKHGHSFSAIECRGVVQVRGSDFVCLAFTDRQGDSWLGNCRRAFNLRRANNYWNTTTRIGNANLVESIGATNVMALKEQQVSYYYKQKVTFVDKMWFGFFAAKLAIVVALFAISALLRAKNLRCVLHDEQELIHLLRLNISQQVGHANNEVSLYLHGSSSERRGKKSFWVSGRPQLRPVNIAANQLELERS